MRGERLHIGWVTAPAIFISLLLVTSASAAGQESVLHSFHPSSVASHRHAPTSDGYTPYWSDLTLDAAGNVYGTTASGGAFNYGIVFKLTRTSGGWTESILYNFGQNLADGAGPYGGLIFDAAGNLYGTTFGGGSGNAGVVFELSPNGGGGWIETVLYNFNPSNGTDGYGPYATLIFDAAGNLYGTTELGGAYDYGTAFKLTPIGEGLWIEQVLHSFGNGTDGFEPNAPLVLDAAGNLYGTTPYGGTTQPCGDLPSCGIVFKLSPNGSGGWTAQVLHNFANNERDGKFPSAGALIFDASGNLYGTTSGGGTNLCEGAGGEGCGTVYELSPAAGGNWTEQVLYSFNYNGTDGVIPTGLVFDAAGNLDGTTTAGGLTFSGAIFQLTRVSGGWTEQVLYSFNTSEGGGDGINPYAGLIVDGKGNLYGTTHGGGAYDAGTVFEFTP